MWLSTRQTRKRIIGKGCRDIPITTNDERNKIMIKLSDCDDLLVDDKKKV